MRPRFWVEAVPVRVVARRDWDAWTAAVPSVHKCYGQNSVWLDLYGKKPYAVDPCRLIGITLICGPIRHIARAIFVSPWNNCT